MIAAHNRTTRTSITEILRIRRVWIPVPGSPNKFLYLHRFIYIYKYLLQFYNESPNNWVVSCIKGG